jgi:type II secretory pathway component GspD/PulD (secretin)
MGGNMQGGYIAQNLRDLIQQSIDPDSWYDLSDTGEGTVMVYPQDQPRKLAIFQTPEVHARIEELLDQLRKSLGEQVSIEARFLTVSENFLQDVGLDLDLNYNLGGKFGLVTLQQDSFLTAAPDVSTKVPGSLGSITPGATATGGYGSILDNLQATFLIRATQARVDSSSLAAPKVTVLSGETASFTLYDYLTYVPPPLISQGITSTIGGAQQQQGIQTDPQQFTVGSTLSVTPTITKDKKYVLLNIQSQQTDLLRFRTHIVQTLTGGDIPEGGTAQDTVATYPVTVPETEEAMVSTRVNVPDGGTLLLGGHKLTQEVDKESGVPILSKIPIIGKAFSNRSKIRDAKVLLILVKPTIMLQEEREQEALAGMESVNGLN